MACLDSHPGCDKFRQGFPPGPDPCPPLGPLALLLGPAPPLLPWLPPPLLPLPLLPLPPPPISPPPLLI